MATQNPVLFMSTKTPGNFKGKRQQEEIRALALRAASFSRPNRKKAKKVIPKDATSISSEGVSPVSETSSTEITQSRSTPLKLCLICGKALTLSPKKTTEAPADSTQRYASRHHVCTQRSTTIAPTTAVGLAALSGPDIVGMCDPFTSFPVALPTETRNFLNYIKSFTFQINWPDELSACDEGNSLFIAHSAMYREFFRHPAPMNGLLSYVHNLMAIAQPDRAAFHRERSTEYSLKCFQSLRALIDGLNQSEEQLMAILMTLWPLSSAEYSESFRTGNDGTFQHHRGAMRRTINLMGGLRCLPMVFRELFVSFFSRIAVVTNTPIEIDPASWDPGPWQGSIGTSIPLPETFSAGDHSVLGRDTLESILAALRELVAVEMIKRRGIWSDADHVSPVWRWTHLRRSALKMHLWNMLHPRNADPSISDSGVIPDASELGPQSSVCTSLTLCVCLAAQLFIYLSLETRPIRQPWYAAPKQYEQMLEQLQGLDIRHLLSARASDLSGSSEPGPDFKRRRRNAKDQALDLLWILAIGACFEEELSKQQSGPQSGKLVVIARAAGFWDNKGSNATQQPAGPSDPDEASTQPEWCSRRFSVLARRLGYDDFNEVRDLFTTKFIYDTLIMDTTLSSLFG